MSDEKLTHELPKNIEKYLAALSKIYLRDSETRLLEILVNSEIRIHEEWDHDSWNGGTWGHALYLTVPETLFLDAVEDREVIQTRIRDDLNKIQNVQNEWISEVFIELGDTDTSDWRRESGVLFSNQAVVGVTDQARVWPEPGFKLFLSHKVEYKSQVADLKKRLARLGIAAFVAHEDIHPTQEWQNEIENALFSMDALVAIMTDGFRDSDWTDQEVGVAVGRQVPIVSVRLGTDPYGFIGKYQALTCNWDTAAIEIAKLLINHPLMLEAYLNAAESCTSFDHGNELAAILPAITHLSDHQAQRLVEAYNNNYELRGSFGFNGNQPGSYGLGLAAHLSRVTEKNYTYSESKIIES